MSNVQGRTKDQNQRARVGSLGIPFDIGHGARQGIGNTCKLDPSPLGGERDVSGRFVGPMRFERKWRLPRHRRITVPLQGTKLRGIYTQGCSRSDRDCPGLDYSAPSGHRNLALGQLETVPWANVATVCGCHDSPHVGCYGVFGVSSVFSEFHNPSLLGGLLACAATVRDSGAKAALTSGPGDGAGLHRGIPFGG
jgi:hypothetical protein